MSVSDARLNGLIRIELVNDFSDIIEQNPVLYLRTWEEVSQALHQPKAEKQQSRRSGPRTKSFFISGRGASSECWTIGTR